MSPECLPIRVYYEDTDAGGIVYHTNYLKYMERARAEYFQTKFGEDLFALQAQCHVQFVIGHISIDFLKPAVLGQRLIVQSYAELGRRASIQFEQTVITEETQTVLCKAEIKVVCVNQEGRPCALPDFIRRTS